MGKIILITVLLLAVGCDKLDSQIKKEPSPAHGYTHRLKVGNRTLLVEIVKTPAAMQQGLSARNKMDDSQGMFFDFGKDVSVSPGFWMKDMKFNLDIIWVHQNKIVGITAEVQAPTKNLNVKIENLPLYYPPSPVDSVLEVKAGWAKKNNVKLGDVVELK